MPNGHCKSAGFVAGRRGRARRGLRGFVSLCAAGLLALGACSRAGSVRIVSVRSLELARSHALPDRRRAILVDASQLGEIYRPLGERLGLIEVHTHEQWRRLLRLAPEIGPCPDLAAGIAVGVVSRIGQPVDGHWPIHVAAVRHHNGAGLLEADFTSGNYLPDGTAYLELAHVPKLQTVLIVEINGVRFYPG